MGENINVVDRNNSDSEKNTQKDKDNSAKKFSRFKPASIIIFLIFCLSILGIVASVGKYISAPFETSQVVDKAISESYCSKGGAIIDQSSTRLILLDSNNQISYIVSTDLLNDKPYFYGSVVAADDGVYVQRYLYANSSDYIKQGQIVRYSYNGQNVKVIAQYDLNMMEDRVLKPLISSMTLDGRTLYACTCNTRTSVSSIYAIDLDSASLPVDLKGDTYIAQYTYLLDDVDAMFVKYDVNSKRAYFVNQLGGVFYDETVYSDKDTFKRVDAQGDVGELLDLDLSTSPVKIVTQMGSEGKNFAFAPILCARLISFWLALIVAIIIALYFVVTRVYAAVKNSNFALLKPASAVIAVVIVVTGIVAFYAYNLYTNQQSSKTKMLSTACATMALGYNDTFADASEEFADNGKLTAGTYNSLAYILESQTHASAINENEVVYTLLAIKDGKFYQLADSAYDEISGVSTDEAFSSDLKSIVSSKQGDAVFVSSEKNIRGNYIVALNPIYDSQGNVVGALTAGDSVVTTSAKNLKSQATVFIALLAAAVSLSFLLMESNKWILHFKQRKQRKKEGEGSGSEFFLARPINFLAMAASSCGSALVVLMTKDMIAGTALAGNSLILMLPTLLTTLGCLAGALIFGALMPKMRAKTLYVACGVVAAIGFTGCVLSVAHANVIALCLSLFIANAGIQVFAAGMGGLSSYTHNKETRTMLRMDMSESSITSYALSTIVASFIASSLGNTFVYGVGVILSLVLIVFILVLFPSSSVFDSNKYIDENASRKKFSLRSSETQALLRLVFNPVIVTLVLGVSFTMSLVNGYGSFLFPLIASDGGFDKSAVAQTLVFCSALAFYLSPTIKNIQEKYGMRQTLAAVTLILGLLFVSFLANHSLVWSIVVLAIAGVLSKVISIGQGSIWTGMIDKVGSPVEPSITAKNATSSINSIITSPVMGLLAMLGGMWSCFVLGVYAIIGSIAFKIACYRDEH